jgi:hypothetical protein
MKKKLIALILVIAIIAIVSPLIYVFLQPQPLKSNSRIILTDSLATLYLNTYTDGTLFRCVDKIEYLSTDGNWKTISSQTGTMDANSITNGRTYYLNNFQPSDDMDFKYFASGMTSINFNESMHFKNLKIEPYGYRLP